MDFHVYGTQAVQAIRYVQDNLGGKWSQKEYRQIVNNMTFKQFQLKAKKFFREQLRVTDYIDVNAAALNIRNNIPFRGPTIYILFAAIVIASVGLNVNSIPVIIGAMLISPLMSPIIGFGMGLGTNDTQLLLTAAPPKTAGAETDSVAATLRAEDLERIHNWLTVRLQEANVEVIVR